MMKIAVSNIPEEGLDLRFSKDRGWFEKNLTDHPEACTCTRDIEVSCRLKRLNENVFLDGSVATVLELACCRCLEPATLPINAAFRYTLAPLPESQDREVELGGDDLECGYYREGMIELEPLLIEQILLQIPIRVLCGESCRGLCPRCGANLNQGDCRCRGAEIDERFAVLKNLKISKNK
jgi:uncharacterized protein